MTETTWADLLAGIVKADDDVTIAVAGVDALGRLFGKRFTHSGFAREADNGFAVCSTNLTWGADLVPVEGIELSGAHNGYPSFRLMPDRERVLQAPWWGQTLVVLADIVDEQHRAISVSPREILRQQVDELERTHGILAQASVELEFLAFRGREWGDAVPAFRGPGNYSFLAESEVEDLLAPVRRHLAQAGIPVEAMTTESGRGQIECTLEPSSPLLAADRAAIFKAAVREIARQQGITVTFMAKPFSDDAGNGGHLHVSLWRGAENLFAPGWPETANDASSALAGVLALGPALCLFYAPNLNSYKRLQPTSFAPTSVGWGHDNRTTAVRAIGGNTNARLELRIPGADACPHLALAAMLSALRYGMTEKLKLVAPAKGDGCPDDPEVEALPRTLEEAITCATASQAARSLFGQPVLSHYARLARGEADAFCSSVTDWERDRYWNTV